jgi:hypothetical protein
MRNLIKKADYVVDKINDALSYLVTGSFIIAAVIIAVLVFLPCLPFILIWSHFSDKKFQKAYNLYLQQMNGACFFFYNNRKSSVAFAREVVAPELAPSVRSVFVEGLRITVKDEQGFMSRMLAGVKDRRGFPYLIKVVDGQVLDCSVNHQFYNTMAGGKPIAQLLTQINSFYTSTALIS